MNVRRSLRERHDGDARPGALARLAIRQVPTRRPRMTGRTVASLSVFTCAGLAAFSAGGALAQGTPPPAAPASVSAPAAAAAVRDEASKPAGTKPGAPVGFTDAVNHGFIRNLEAPPPPAIDRIRGVRLPGIEPAGAASAQPVNTGPGAKPSDGPAASASGSAKPTAIPAPGPGSVRAEEPTAPTSPAHAPSESTSAKPAP